MYIIDNPYNMNFTPEGKSAGVVAEARKRLDFYDPATPGSRKARCRCPTCDGINRHADYPGRRCKFVLFTCEFAKSLVKIDVANRSVVSYLHLSGGDAPGHP